MKQNLTCPPFCAKRSQKAVVVGLPVKAELSADKRESTEEYASVLLYTLVKSKRIFTHGAV